jgi:hypothetical protein
MKTLHIFLVLLAVVFALNTGDCQNMGKNSSKDIENILKSRKYRRYLGLDMGLNTYWTQLGAFAPEPQAEGFKLNNSRSWVFKYNFLEKGWDLMPSKKLRFITGLGIQHNVFRLKESVSLVPGPLVSLEDLAFTEIQIRKNNWRLSTLTLPLLLDWNTAPGTSKNFHVGLGLELGLRLGIRTRVAGSSPVEGSDGEVYLDNVIHNNFHSQWMQNSLMLRMGYGNFTLFANYGLQPIFEESKGPSIRLFQMGVRVLAL